MVERVASEGLCVSLYLSRMSEGGRGAVSCVGFHLRSAVLGPLRTTKDGAGKELLRIFTRSLQSVPLSCGCRAVAL